MTHDSWEVFASISDRPKAKRTPRARDIMQQPIWRHVLASYDFISDRGVKKRVREKRKGEIEDELKK